MADYTEGSMFTPIGSTAFQSAGGPTIKRYSTTPEVVEAARVTTSNLEELARWCGGDVREDQSHDVGVFKYVLVPSIGGALWAKLGWWLVKHLDTGRFDVKSEKEFEAFHLVGLRDQDKPHPRTGGSITKYRGDTYPRESIL